MKIRQIVVKNFRGIRAESQNSSGRKLLRQLTPGLHDPQSVAWIRRDGGGARSSCPLLNGHIAIKEGVAKVRKSESAHVELVTNGNG